MKKLFKLLATLLIAFTFATPTYAEGIKKVAQTSMKWLAIPVGARPTALGGAFFTTGGNASDVYWNPAGIALVESPQVFFSHLPWIADINQYAAALALPIMPIGVFSVDFRMIDFGPQQGTRISTDPEKVWEYTNEFSPSAYQFGIGFAQLLSDRFSYGLHLSYALENLGDVLSAPVTGGSVDNPETISTSLNVINFDFGALYYTGFYDLRIGVGLRNFSNEKGYGVVGNSIPMDLRFGMAMNLLSPILKDSKEHQLIFSWEISHPRDYSERFHFGIEYIFSELVALRAGYKTNYDEENISFGFGILPKLGIGVARIGLDYAYLPFGVFDALQTFSIVISR